MTALAGTRVVVLGGASGLLGQELVAVLAAEGAAVRALSRRDADVLDQAALSRVLREARPGIVCNAVAYTAVDKAEDEPEAAFALNAKLPERLGRLCGELGALLVHYSTDFDFDGAKRSPYLPEDPAAPLSVYGASKLVGEQALLGLGLSELLIVRTSWLFGPGRANFVHKILGLARERGRLAVVDDQTGSPSYTRDLARNTVELLRKGARGLLHLANSGATTWCGLARAAVELAGIGCPVEAVPTSAYPTRAVRPAYSVLDLGRFREITGFAPRPWREALRDYVVGDLGLKA